MHVHAYTLQLLASLEIKLKNGENAMVEKHTG